MSGPPSGRAYDLMRKGYFDARPAHADTGGFAQVYVPNIDRLRRVVAEFIRLTEDCHAVALLVCDTDRGLTRPLTAVEGVLRAGSNAW